MAEQEGDKTQEPTVHRRQQAREQGQVARSQDLGSATLLVGGLLLILSWGGAVVDHLGGLTRRQLGEEAWLQLDIDTALGVWRESMSGLTSVALPILAAMLGIGVAVNLLQVGILFLPEKLAPDLRRVDPLAGLGRLFSLANLVRLGLGLGKIVIVGWVAYICVVQEHERVLGLVDQTPGPLASELFQVLWWTTLKIGVALLLLAALDYGFQWWKQEQDLRMTNQEVREELRNLQGDPNIAARRKSVQRQLVLNRLSTAVPKADVVITNPTELAIAIHYDATEMAAPVVVAKGAGILAQRIRRLALENGIPIVEKKPLAQLLYKEVEINQPIPSQTYSAVAEVLAYVYQLRGKTAPDNRAA